jgi:hypothetical protein
VPAVEQPKEATAEEMTAAVAYTAEAPAAPAAEIITVPILSQYHSQDELGAYNVSPVSNRYHKAMFNLL